MSTSWRPWRAGSSPEGRTARPAPAAALAAALAFLAGGLASAPGAPAQQTRQVDSGRFTITDRSGATSTERFAIRREAERFQSAGRITPDGPGGAAAGDVLEFRLQLDAELRPTFFEITDRGPGDEGVVGVRAGNRIQLRSRTGEGERWQELLLAPGLVVIPRGVAHPYYFVVQVLESGRVPPIPVLSPDAGERRSLTVEARRSDAVTVGGREIAGVLRELRVDGELHRVWTDQEGRVLRVELPDRSWTAVRTEPPGDGP